MKENIKLFYAPRSRAFTALWVLEEAALDYTLESFDLNSGRHKNPDYLALNPMGKVPLIVDKGIPVSELGAIAIYLADRYPDTRLAPAFTDEKRAAFLRWIFFSGAIIEPALGEKFFKWQVPARSVAWGSYDQMIEVANAGVAEGPYLLGQTFSAADVLVGSTLRFGLRFGAIDKGGPIETYVSRLETRAAFKRASAIEERESARFPMPRS